MNIDTTTMKYPGIDGTVSYSRSYKVIRKTKNMGFSSDDPNELNSFYFKGDNFSVELKELENEKRIVICANHPKMDSGTHNLYYVAYRRCVSQIKRVLRKIREAGLLVKAKHVQFYDIDFGFNLDLDYNTYKYFFRLLAHAKYERFKGVSINRKDAHEYDSQEEIGHFKKRGLGRFMFYCKTTELKEKYGIEIKERITRIEYPLSSKELISLFGTNKMCELEKVDKLEKIIVGKIFWENVFMMENNLDIFKKTLEIYIKNFKKNGKRGLLKSITKKYIYFDKRYILEALEANKDLVAKHYHEYRREIENNDDRFRQVYIQTLNYIKSMSVLFFIPVFPKTGKEKVSTNMLLAFMNKGLKEFCKKINYLFFADDSSNTPVLLTSLDTLFSDLVNLFEELLLSEAVYD